MVVDVNGKCQSHSDIAMVHIARFSKIFSLL
jgi:hypothetical protein